MVIFLSVFKIGYTDVVIESADFFSLADEEASSFLSLLTYMITIRVELLTR